MSSDLLVVIMQSISSLFCQKITIEMKWKKAMVKTFFCKKVALVKCLWNLSTDGFERGKEGECDGQNFTAGRSNENDVIILTNFWNFIKVKDKEN